MRTLMILGVCVSLLTSCKDNQNESAPDPVVETPVDSVLRDNIVADDQTMPEVEANSTIEVSAADGKMVEVQYATFGGKFSADKALTQEQMLKKYGTMKKGDTIAVKFKSTITEVCKKKGCWMKMDLAGKESFVRFKDYGFFVPLNADKSQAIVSGRAYIDEISVDELKHYAKDGGESQEDIDKIVSPKITYAFQADGVLIEK